MLLVPVVTLLLLFAVTLTTMLILGTLKEIARAEIGAQLSGADEGGVAASGPHPPSRPHADTPLEQAVNDHTAKQPAPPSAPSVLSARETKVLALLAAGKTNHEIADELVLSVPTVEQHVGNLYTKIGVHNRAQAATYGTRSGLAQPAAR